MAFFENGEYFPPKEHLGRITRYRENKQLFEGKHWELFRKHNSSNSHKMYVSVNLSGVIAKKSADFLIGDGVQVSAGKEDNSKEQLAFDRITEDNDLDILFYESALANAYRGDSFFKIRYGQEHDGLYPQEFDPSRVRIETVSAENVFPEVATHNPNLITAYHVAIPIRVDAFASKHKKNNYKLQVESHFAGRIEYREYYLTVFRTDVDGTPLEYKIGGLVEDSYDIVYTGVPVPLIVHVPNYAVDDGWCGIDDLTELKPMLDELNNRLSQIADIMDKHSNPAMAIPPNLMAEDADGRLMFRVADSKVFEVDKQDIMPQYITWNGQLNEAYAEIDRLISMILTTAEIPEVALGMGDSGTSGSSGLAIKWRMNSLLSKVKRKRKYYEKALKQVFMIAQYLEHSAGVADYEVTVPKLTFSDGLPTDDMEQTTIALQKTGGAILMSRKTALMRLEGLTEEQAQAEIDRIDEEQDAISAKETRADPSIFNSLFEDDDPEDYGEDWDVEDQVIGDQGEP